MNMSSDPSSPSPDRRPTIALTVSFRGTPHAISLPLSSPVYPLHIQLENLTDVPPALQKLLYKGKKLIWKSEEDAQNTSLEKAGLKDGMKVQLLGSTLKEIEGLKKEEAEHLRRERIMRERALKASVKPRTTGSGVVGSSSPALQYRFHDIEALAHLPNSSDALSVLQRLASDPAINHIMEKHRLSVGLLTELAPHEHPDLLGLNKNMGMVILLRVRTNAYDGFRSYKEVRRVLCHELAHNMFGDHDEYFKEFNSRLNREVAEFERSIRRGTHRLDDGASGEIYQPASSELEAEARTYVLGSGSTIGSDLNSESLEERRRKILEATMNRLRKEEEVLEQSCGTGKTTS